MAGHPVIEGYIQDLSGRLPGPRRWRQAVLDEARDTLLDAMEAHARRGGNPAEAAAQAVREYGPAWQVSRAYAPELAAALARRAGLQAIVAIPLIAAIWNAALHIGPAAPWRHQNAGLTVAAALIASGVTLTVLCSGLTIIGTGPAVRFTGDRPRALRFLSITASAAVTAAILALLGVVITRAATSPGSLEWPAAVPALALSLAVIGAVAHSAGRCITGPRVTPGRAR
ncbi:MAG: permease prefix domain 1-containing protein [Streptosporangiaceae bacterium]